MSALMPSRPRTGQGRASKSRGLTTIAALLAICSAAAACSSTTGSPKAPSTAMSDNAMHTAATHVGDLVITGAYIPAPASPDVAAAYLTVTNRGGTPDTLVKVTTSVTRSVMPMSETSNGGTGSMTDLDKVTIPAHGVFRFRPDHAHLMLEQPTRTLTAGDRVTMTLTFAHAGTARLTLPVEPTTGPSTMPSMSGMSG